MKNFKIREVIFIDDDEIVILVGKKILKMIGYEGKVSYYLNGLEALKNIEERTAKGEFELKSDPIVVFLDINMPIMDAWDFMNSFKEFPQTIKENFKIAIVTNSYNPSDKLKTLEYLDLLDFMNKPLSPVDYLEFFKKNEFYKE